MPEKLTIGDCSTLDVSGAHNVVYAIPAEEHDDGIPHVFVWGNVGSGMPMLAYHDRWLYVGHVLQKAVPEEVERVLREHEDEILKALEAYRGSEWDGRNIVGKWQHALDAWGDAEVELHSVREALSEVATFWDASDWFTAVSFEDYVSGDDLDATVDFELTDALREGAHLEAGNVRDYLVWAAQQYVDKHEDDEEVSEHLRIARIWAAQG